MKDKWKEKLSESQYRILREKGTEQAFTGALLENKNEGSYVCAACGNELFHSETKYDSQSGWPSFYDVIDAGKVELRDDSSFGMSRTEVICMACGSHLGHMFEDGPKEETGQRYCINSAALNFMPEDGGKMVNGDSS